MTTKLKAHPAADLFPMMAGKQWAEFVASVKAHGLREKIVIWHGQILDGRNRYRACVELGIMPSFDTRDDIESPVRFVLDANLHRRHLTESQRAMVAARALPLFKAEAKERRASTLKRGLASPVPANLPERGTGEAREHAAASANVSARSVESAAKVLADGATDLASAVDSGRVAVSTAAEIATVPHEEQTAILALSDADILRRAKEIKRQRANERRARRIEDKTRANEAKHPLGGNAFSLLIGDIEAQCATLDVDSIDAIITDPPYPEEFLPLFEKLARVATRVLRPGGQCLVMVGQSHLPRLLPMLAAKLHYQWTLAYLTPGQSTQVFGRRVKSNWKPVLWFTKGRVDCEHVEDIIRSDENDKRFHEWGQSVSGMAAIIERFTLRGATVLDPFVGGGATAIAARQLGRFFIGVDSDAACVRTTAARLATVQESAG